jgi:hypothetical protein
MLTGELRNQIDRIWDSLPDQPVGVDIDKLRAKAQRSGGNFSRRGDKLGRY